MLGSIHTDVPERPTRPTNREEISLFPHSDWSGTPRIYGQVKSRITETRRALTFFVVAPFSNVNAREPRAIRDPPKTDFPIAPFAQRRAPSAGPPSGMAGRIPHPTRRSRPRGSRALVFAVLVALCAASLPVPTFADVSLASVTVASPLAYAGDSFTTTGWSTRAGCAAASANPARVRPRLQQPVRVRRVRSMPGSRRPGRLHLQRHVQRLPGTSTAPRSWTTAGCVATPRIRSSRAGIPDYHLGGCVGCDGVPNSGNVLDACGVCAGLGCAPSDETKRSWCCDCAGVPFGPHIINFCCECVDRFAHWGALSGAKGPPENHSRAEFLWAKGRSILADADAAAAHLRSDIANRTAAGLGATFNRSETVYATYVDAIAHFDAGWEAISHPFDDLSECYSTRTSRERVQPAGHLRGVRRRQQHVPRMRAERAEPARVSHSGRRALLGRLRGVRAAGRARRRLRRVLGGNETCVGCDGVPNSGKVMDGCDGSQDFRFLSFMGRLGEVGSGCSDPDEPARRATPGRGMLRVRRDAEQRAHARRVRGVLRSGRR